MNGDDEMVTEQKESSDEDASFNPGYNSLSTGASMQQQQKQRSFFVVILTLLAVIGGFLFGYDTGVVSGAMILLKAEFRLNYVWQEAFVSITLGVAALFAILGGITNDRFGRKPTIILSSIVFIIGSVLLAAATRRWELIVGRAVLGIGIGFSSATIPMYIAESAPRHLRGQLVTLNNMFITGGQLAASVISGLFSGDQHNGWRYMLGLAAVPAITQLFGFIFMPESPRWLISKGRCDDAKLALQKIRGKHIDVTTELEEIMQTEEERHLNGGSTIIRILQTPHVRWALFVGVILQAFQQITGINTVMYYSATIIQMSGVHNASLAIWLAALTASVNLMFSFVGLYLVERIGRRLLVLVSLAGTMFSLIVLAMGFQLLSLHTPNVTYTEFYNSTFYDQCSNKTSCYNCMNDHGCGFCYMSFNEGIRNGSCVAVARDEMSREPLGDHSLYGRCSQSRNVTTAAFTWAYEYCPNPNAWMTTFGLVLYLVFFAPGMGPMPWTINSEIYPLWARSTGNSITTSVNWICNLVVAMTFLSLTELITRQGAFWLYASLAALGLMFLWLYLPETKGKSLEAVEALFMGPHLIPCSRAKQSYNYQALETSTVD